MNFQRWIYKNEKNITWATGILIVLGFIFRRFITGYTVGVMGLGDFFLLIASLVAILPIGLKAVSALRLKVFSIELLVLIAVIGALYIGEYVESSVVQFLFLVGAYLEARTLERTRSSIKKLTESAPQEATIILEDGRRERVDVDDVEVGDRILVHPGNQIPVDGVVVVGEAAVNEAALTGESVPVKKEVDSKVMSGSIIDTGYIEMIATAEGDDSTFAKIIELVEEAQDSKSEAERFIDRFSQYYTPGVVVLAFLTYLFSKDLHLAITVLVIACPGALVIGAPVSSVAGIGNGAQNGILFKGGQVVQDLSKVDTLVFDKTGTLTKGRPEVTDFYFINDVNEEEVYKMIGKVETASEHHLGKTIVKFIEDKQDIDLHKVEMQQAEAIKARGIGGIVEGHAILVGNRALMIENNIKISKTEAEYAVDREKKGNTAMYAAIDNELVAIISVADKVRNDAKEAIQVMRDYGIKHVVMLTGDNRHTAAAVAEELGIDEVHAELLPEDKVTHVRRLKEEGRQISMAGDGINDAPAIATADVGLAMGEGGTDVSIETADLVLMADDLMQYAHAYALAKKTMSNMRENIIIALGVVAVLVSGIIFNLVNMSIGMLVHELSILVVILNAMRLLKFKLIES